MAKKEKTELKQTKTKFKLIGVVEGMDKDNAYKMDASKKGKHEGETFRSLRFNVKTSDNNKIQVQMFSYEPEEVFLWNSDKAKEAKDNGKTYKGKRIPFEDWLENQDDYRENGDAVLQSRIGLERDEEGKVISKGLPTYVSIEELHNNLKDGTSVTVEGNISYSTYEKDGKVVENKNFNIERLFVRKEEVDFNDEKFEELTYFEQEVVFVDAVAEKKENKVFVTGRNINYQGKCHDTQFVIDYSDGKDGTDPDMVKLSSAILKKVKFGDVINIYGDILNRVIVEEIEDADEDSFNPFDFGGKKKDSRAEKFTQKSYIRELQITGLDAWDKKCYKESDFEENEELLEKEEKKSELDDFGGKKKDTNPFDLDEDEDANGIVDISEDDLPF